MDGSFADSYGTEVEKDGTEGVEIGSIKYFFGLIEAMKRYGLDISHETSKQLTEERIKDSNKIIIMGEREKIPEWMEKYKYEYWEDCLNALERNKKNNLKILIESFGDADDIEETILFLKDKVINLIKHI